MPKRILPGSAWTPEGVAYVVRNYHSIDGNLAAGVVQAAQTTDGRAIEMAAPSHANYVDPVLLKADFDLAVERLKKKPRKTMKLLFTNPDACEDVSTAAREMNCSKRTVWRKRTAAITNVAIDLCLDLRAGRQIRELLNLG